MNPANSSFRRGLRAVLRTAVTVLAGISVGHAIALNAPADAPLFTGGATAVKPNVMFIMDDSGSMQWDFLPDAASVLHRGMYGRWSAQCNGLAYDPDTTYGVPVYMDASNVLQSSGPAPLSYIAPDPATQTTDRNTVYGVSSDIDSGTTVEVSLAAGSSALYFSAPADTVTVYKDASNYLVGQVTGLSWNGSRYVLEIRVRHRTGSLGSGTRYVGKGEPASGEYYKYKGTQPKLSYYKADGTIDTSSTFYTECTTLTSTASDKFEKVTVVSLTGGAGATHKQNYANWSKYYRNRMMTMQSAASLAFKGLDDRYRIGYSTIGQPKAKTGEPDFLHIQDNTNAHKRAFYDQLYAAKPGPYGTPLRGALAKAGQYFANKAIEQDKDPVQYYCQRNFSILSTDGLWNTGANNSRVDETDNNGYGPFMLNRSTQVKNQDNNLPRPMADGNTLKVVTTEKWDVLKEQTIQQTIPLSTVTVRITGVGGSGITETQRRTNVVRDKSTCGNNRWKRVSVVQQQVYNATRTELTREETTVTGTATAVQLRTLSAVAHQRVVTVTNGVTNSDVKSTSTFTIGDVEQSYSFAPGATTSRFLLPNPDVTVSGNWTQSEVSRTTISGCETSPPTSTGDWVTTSTATLTLSAIDPPDPLPDPRKGTVVEVAVGDPVDKTTDKVVTAEYTSTGGAENTLADVAAYYYKTDLRDTTLGNCTGSLGKDVCANEVPGLALTDPYQSFGDSQRQQHMTTFTLGLGVSGSLKYDPNYITQRTGDFHDIVNRSKNWPNVTSGQNTTVDDLWHAAVNGRGQYFSAGDPNSLVQGLSSALSKISAVTGSASAASTSSLQPVTGDNDIYVAQFTTVAWTGDVLAYKINENTGAVNNEKTWSAMEQLELKTPSTRKIYYKKKGATETELKAFTYDNLDADDYEGLFDGFCSKTAAGGGLSPDQCASLNTDDKKAADDGKNLVAFLRGEQDRTYYRKRAARLGDIINASPLFIGKPGFRYTENDYDKYVRDNANRKAVVLAAANDGMLHAFARKDDPTDTSEKGGDELWAFIPSFVLPNLYKLADNGYESNHSYFVDGSPQIGDIYDGSAWKTIVVGGLNKGGRGYYALDLTDPATPKLLWEFTHDDLGYTYGNPIITKRKDGTWVVVFASGYDNVSPGDGNGHLFVLNANTGALITKISTKTAGGAAIGTEASPSGLARINSWVDSEIVNTSQRFYGGDELGNLWRFDIDSLVEPHGKALRLAQLTGPDGKVQPITAKPALAEVNHNGNTYPVVYVATGTYFRKDDAKNKDKQSIYAIKDPLTNTPYGVVRSSSDFVVQTITETVENNRPDRTSSSNAVDWSTKAGWRADFPVGGERVTVNPQLALDTLYVGSNLPKDDDCSVGGESFLYQFDIATGSSTTTYVGSVLVQGLTVVQLVTGAAAGSIVTIITRSDGTLQTEVGTPPATGGVLRRTSWRELVD